MLTPPHDRSGLLSEQGVPTTLFLDSIDRWIETMVADDRGGDDFMSRFVKAKVIAKENGIICGHTIIERLVEKHASDCSIQWMLEEGDEIMSQDTILEISGNSTEILKIERVLLNILGRLSGISTSTHDWVTITKNMGIACTRKTDWGLLDKWAVHIGGGLTHRLDREDALMLKENDLATMKNKNESEIDALKRMISNIDLEQNSEFTIIEVQNIEQAVVAADTWFKLQKAHARTDPVVLLLDNMMISQVIEIIIKLKELNLRKWCILEGSGGILKDSILDWDASGVDLVSTSAVNRGISPLDLSLIIDGEEK